MLRVNSLQRKYENFVAVNRVSFEIGSGEIVGLLGHNGAGKTTIMKMLSGYLEPSHGSIEIDQQNIVNQPELIQSRLGYLPENLPVYPDMTVLDYLDYAAELKGIQGEHKKREIKRVVLETELTDRLLSTISTLSRGLKQRVGVAQAILGQPKLLILDEPTNGLDPTQTQHMRELIRSVAKHATVILSTHIMQEVEAICDRVLIINKGELIVDEKLADLKETNQILLDTNLSLDKVSELLRNDASIAEVRSNDQGQLLITLSSHHQHQQSTAMIAKKIIQADGDVYQISPITRNLESLFQQVERQGRIENAA